MFAFSENLLGLAPITAPVIALTHAPLLGYNAAFLLELPVQRTRRVLLAFVLTRRHDASFVAAVAFAFAPYRLSHTQHLQLLSSYWMPVAIAALHQYVAVPRWRWAALFAASWLLQALACGYYFFFLTMFVLLWLAWFGAGDLTLREWRRLGAAWLAAACLLAPVLLGYRSIHARTASSAVRSKSSTTAPTSPACGRRRRTRCSGAPGSAPASGRSRSCFPG